MSTVTYTDLRQNLARYLDKALNDRAPITVVRQGKENVILLAEQEYTGMLETLYLLSSPANAEMLLQSIEELNAGKGVERELIYPTIPTPA
jgi:antitoxin YefM